MIARAAGGINRHNLVHEEDYFMRRYEQIYILRPSLNEDEINTIVENTNKIIIDEGGSIIFSDRWGMRKLAYPIKKEVQGYYVFCDCATTPDAISEVERKFRIDDSVLKYLTVKRADAISPEEIEAAKNEAAEKAHQHAVEENAEPDVAEDQKETAAPEVATEKSE